MRWLEPVAQLWSTTRFRAREISAYAERLMVEETRRGVMTLSFVFLVLLFVAVLVVNELALQRSYALTAAALAALSAHVYFSARNVQAIGALHALGMTLLIISGTAFVLLAHRHGGFGTTLFSSIVLLFMVVPMVPWGLREASIVTLLIYGLVSLSAWSVADRFSPETLWSLQLFMLAAGAVSLTLVGRGAGVRRADIRARFDLETARCEMERLSYQDPLTGAWNRRFLEAEFDGFVENARKASCDVVFALLDVDDFKGINDSRGHQFGDRVLQWIGAAFREALADSGFLVRTGGDEFTLLAVGDDPEALIGDAVASLHERASESDEDAVVAVSVGLVAIARDAAVTLDAAYRAADEALYRAKRLARPDGAASTRLVRGAIAAPAAAREDGAG